MKKVIKKKIELNKKTVTVLNNEQISLMGGRVATSICINYSDIGCLASVSCPE